MSASPLEDPSVTRLSIRPITVHSYRTVYRVLCPLTVQCYRAVRRILGSYVSMRSKHKETPKVTYNKGTYHQLYCKPTLLQVVNQTKLVSSMYM